MTTKFSVILPNVSLNGAVSYRYYTVTETGAMVGLK